MRKNRSLFGGVKLTKIPVYLEISYNVRLCRSSLKESFGYTTVSSTKKKCTIRGKNFTWYYLISEKCSMTKYVHFFCVSEIDGNVTKTFFLKEILS